MKKHAILSCLALFMAFSSFGQISIIGTLHACRLDTAYVLVSVATGGGVWTSSNTIVATVGAPAGTSYATVYAVWPGTATITYTSGSGTATATFTVDPSPTEFAGLTTLCVGVSSTYTDAIVGGTWTSSDPSSATIDPVTGYITGVSPGTPDITYSLSDGCSLTAGGLTITHTPTGAISGASSICIGAAAAYTDPVTGGAWSSSNPAIAFVDSATGVASAVSAGTVSIIYTANGICGPVSIYDTIVVSSSLPAPVLSGPSSMYTGATIALSATVAGDTWTSSNTAVATVSSSGVVSGISPGTATITYSVTGCSGVVTASTTITVSAFEGITGHVLFSSGFTGPVRVWLITYDPITYDLEALDSTTITCSGDSSVYYQFTGLATDSFRVKAAVSFATSYTSMGYVPTYHTSSYYWHDADVIYHTSGAVDMNKDITMAAGSTVTGPGFIAGSITSGANRGTSDGAGVANVLVYVVNSATGQLMQQTYTNGAGGYAFLPLPYGTYLVYPELINYTTIPYASITLSAGGPSISSADFIEHTVSHVISPVNEAVKNVASGSLSVIAYPNPASDKLNILWNETTTETGNVTLADITGKAVYKTTVSMKAGTGTSQLSLPSLTDGAYILTIKSPNISYSNKIEIVH